MALPLSLEAAASVGRTALSVAATASGAFALLFSAASAVFGLQLLRALKRRPPAAALPPVTVIKPLKGAEATLYDNLAAFCRQDYPCYQVLLCLQSPDDPALAVASRLKKDFPEADLEVVVSKNRIGYNPKVNNMANAYPFAKYDLLLMSDSDVRVGPGFLRRMVAPFADPGVGMVTAFYEATGSHGAWGHLEALSVNANFLPQALCAARFGMRFAMGAAMMVRRAAFEASGAFRNLADHLADDYWLGESIREAGWRLELCDEIVAVVPSIDDGPAHVKHLVRWARTIRTCQPAGHAASVVLHGFTLLTLKVLLLGPEALTLCLLGALWATKAAASATLGRALGGRQPVRALWLIPLNEWLAATAWVAAWSSTRVLWRGELFDVQPEGLLVPVDSSLPRRPVTVEP